MGGAESSRKGRKSIGEQVESLGLTTENIDYICRHCGDKTMVSSSAYLRRIRYFSGNNKVIAKAYGKKCCYYGLKNKHSFRLIAIAVSEEFQGLGYAAMMLSEIIEMCIDAGLESITLRTHKNGKALSFWKKMGAAIVGEKGDDYEMKIVL